MVSRKLVEAVKLSHLRAYQIAHLAGLHPAMLSKIINGIELVKPGDPRVIKVARVVGLKAEECFRKQCTEVRRNSTPGS